jgi:hypothetical protein
VTDQQGYGGASGDSQEVDLVDLHEVEVLDEVRSSPGGDDDVDQVPDDVIDLDDEHVVEDDEADVMLLDSWQIQLAATGDEQVDAALARLTEVEGLPPSRHAEIYEAVHVGLTGALADLDRS